jgi:hypothetical protein
MGWGGTQQKISAGRPPVASALHTTGECGMVTREDLESFFLRMEDLEVEEIEEGMYLARSRTGGAPMVVNHSPPLLLLRMKVMDLPEARPGDTELFRTLLELNARDVVHGAYGLEDRELILSDTLELETLDFHELQASIESMELAAAGHMERIRSLAGVGAGASTAEG